MTVPGAWYYIMLDIILQNSQILILAEGGFFSRVGLDILTHTHLYYFLFYYTEGQEMKENDA